MTNQSATIVDLAAPSSQLSHAFTPRQFSYPVSSYPLVSFYPLVSCALPTEIIFAVVCRESDKNIKHPNNEIP